MPRRCSRAVATAARGSPRVRVRDPWRRWEISVVESAETEPRAPRCRSRSLDRLKRAIAGRRTPDSELLTALAELALAEPPSRGAAPRA